jgi:hypothetical protein
MFMATKTYRHRTAGAKFIMPDGRDISFAGGEFRTDDAKIQEELDKIANIPASQIYTTDRPVKGREEGDVARDVMAGATSAFDAEYKIPAGTKTIPIPVASDPKPILTPEIVEAAGVETNTGQPTPLLPTPPVVKSAGEDLMAKAKAALAKKP